MGRETFVVFSRGALPDTLRKVPSSRTPTIDMWTHDQRGTAAPAQTRRGLTTSPRAADLPALAPFTRGSLLALQRSAGNAAVVAALRSADGAIVQRQPVGPKATTAHSGTAGLLETFLAPDKGPFTIQIMSLTDDIIGHAWIGVKRADGQNRTVGFWPNSVYSGILGPGKIYMPDPHAGEEMHEYEQSVTFAKVSKLLDVVERWQGSLYSLLGHHCATFAHEAYTTVTGENFDAMFDDAIVMWTPATLGASIDDRKKMEAAVKKASGGKQSMIETGEGAPTSGLAVADAGTSGEGSAAPAAAEGGGPEEDEGLAAVA
jgi:hypothetical protein